MTQERLFAAILILLCALKAESLFAAGETTVTVGRCSIDVVIMQTAEEHSKGMLGYTERTFPYGGMLFEMGGKGVKSFHTMGMQMPIRIMGVAKQSSGAYTVTTAVFKAPPGIQRIPIDAPDVLELPESKYQLWFKKCLVAGEAALP